MRKTLIAPIVAIAIGLVLLVTAGLNYQSSSTSSEVTQDYFIKPVQADQVLVVEPNLLDYVLSDRNSDPSGEELFNSLDEIRQSYVIRKAKQVNTERKGSTIPNLFVYVQPKAESLSQSNQVVASVEP